jgi:ribosomal protein L11 methyltransferase
VADAWLEVSLLVDGELAEAAAEVLGRFVSGGVVIESTRIEPVSGEWGDETNEGRPVGPLRVSGYLPVDDSLTRTRHKLEEALWHLGRIQPLPEPGFRLVQAADWAEAWKENFQPFPAGKRLLIAPTWAAVEPAGREVLRIDPGMAFGTGTHPSTQLCLELLDDFLDEGRRARPERTEGTNENTVHPSYFAHPEPALGNVEEPPADRPLSVIDVGCGSGILAIAALRLGARRALAVDTDPEAVKAARENAAVNGVQERLEVGLGSVAEVLAGRFTFRQAEIVVANILATVIGRLLGEGLGDLLAPGGVLILSGILEHQVAEVLSAASARGLSLFDQRRQGDWVTLAVR